MTVPRKRRVRLHRLREHGLNLVGVLGNGWWSLVLEGFDEGASPSYAPEADFQAAAAEADRLGQGAITAMECEHGNSSESCKGKASRSKAGTSEPAEGGRSVVVRRSGGAKAYRSPALAAIHEGMSDLHSAGFLNSKTMREFDESCLTPVLKLSATAIRGIRIKAHISQAVFAAHLNVTPGVVSKWERGEKQPSGSAAKLLQACDLGVESGEKCGDIHVGFSVRRPGEGWWKVRVPYALPASRKKEAALAAPWARPIRRRGWLLQLPLS